MSNHPRTARQVYTGEFAGRVMVDDRGVVVFGQSIATVATETSAREPKQGSKPQTPVQTNGKKAA